MKIVDFLSEDSIIVSMGSIEKNGVLDELLSQLAKAGKIRDKKKILDSLSEREKLGSTGIGQGIAVPHTKTDQVDELVGALGISKKGVDFESLDGEPVYLIFLVLAPIKATGIHLKALAKTARLLKDRVFRNSLRDCTNPAEAIKIIEQDEEKLNKLA